MPQGPPKPTNAFGQDLPLSPEQDYPGQLIQMLLGTVGLGDAQAKSNLAGQLLGAAVPFVGATKRLANPIRAYHGSPADFDQFSSKHIGTGEGAQAYGHGLYFAENPGVAADYARRVGNAQLVSDPRQLAEYFKPGRLVPGYSGTDRVLQFNPGTDQAGWSVVVQRVDAQGNPHPAERPRVHFTAPTQAEYIQTVNPARKGMYEVNIHADPSQMLDWDKPLSEQPAVVRDAVLPTLQRIAATTPNAGVRHAIETGTATGRDIHHWLAGEAHIQSGFAVPPSEAAANTLREAGVPGIKYLDAGSRQKSDITYIENQLKVARETLGRATTQAAHDSAATEVGYWEEVHRQALREPQATHNYVLFHDDIIEITKKYGIGLPFAAILAEKLRQQRGGSGQ